MEENCKNISDSIMEVGEYCRTDKGKIGKIVHFEPRDKYPYSDLNAYR